MENKNERENVAYHDGDGRLLKLFYVCVFYLIYSLSDVVLLCIAILQTILNAFTGEPSSTLRNFGANLGEYVKQISVYVSYGHVAKPFPFSDWPEVHPSDSETQN